MEKTEKYFQNEKRGEWWIFSWQYYQISERFKNDFRVTFRFTLHKSFKNMSIESGLKVFQLWWI